MDIEGYKGRRIGVTSCLLSGCGRVNFLPEWRGTINMSMNDCVTAGERLIQAKRDDLSRRF